jgi:hypothetical protein
LMRNFMYIFNDVLDLESIESYKNTIATHFSKMLQEKHDYFQFYPTRNFRLTLNDPAVNTIKDHIEKRVRVKLTCYEIELQTWAIGIESTLHNHNDPGRGHGDYNSLLYLNDDFDGGEFFTEDGLFLKPKTNMLTFFNGKDIGHGVKKVSRNHRYTMILWWKNTQFY